MLAGFVELKGYLQDKGQELDRHVDAALSTIYLVQEQLDATANVIEFGE